MTSRARTRGIALGVALVAVVGAWALRRAAYPPTLHAAGPLQISNRTSTPVTLWGHRFPRDAQVRLDPGPTLSAVWQDDEHLGLVVPPLDIPPNQVRMRVKVHVLDASGRTIAGESYLDVVNDAAFRDPVALAVDPQGHQAVVSPNTDELIVDGTPRLVGDGPRAVTTWTYANETWWVVTLEDEGALRLVSTSTPGRTRTIAVGGRPQRTVIDARRQVGYVSDRAASEVVEVALAQGVVRRRIRVDAQPDALVIGDEGRTLWISALGAETIASLDLTVSTATPSAVIMGPGAAIIGGPTAPYARYVMGGKPARALAVAPKLGVVFAATLGPNIGPNPDRMEVSMASGVTVIDARTRRFVRHVPLDRGIAQDLAWDAGAERLYVADVGAGRVVVFDGAQLAASDGSARTAQLGAFEAPVPPGLVRIREDAELAPAIPRRPSPSVHLGPWALALNGSRLLVLERFARTVDVFEGGAMVARTALDDRPETQPTRRRGEIVYYTDVGNSRMSCDTCHPDGRDGGLLFTKGQPIQIHRSPSIRSAHDSAPFFTPAKLASLSVMAHVVLTRNRYQDPPASPVEVAALAEYVRAFTAPPSPYRPDAELPAELVLPDGRRGHPRDGRRIFEGSGGCADARCHPSPHFTADQDPATRGLFHDVGTPRHLALREAMQDAAPALLPPPSLLGVWDNYPLLFSGAAGFVVDGDRVVARDRFALARALELHAHPPLDDDDVADLLAYLLTL